MATNGVPSLACVGGSPRAVRGCYLPCVFTPPMSMQSNNRRTRLASMLVLASALVLSSSSAAANPIAGEPEPEPAANLSDPYTLSVDNGAAKVGESGTITVTIKAAEGFKCNTEYPNKVKGLAATNKAELASTSVAGRFEGKNLVFEIQATPKKRGAAKVTGEVRFSVCDATSCQMKKVPLAATITGT